MKKKLSKKLLALCMAFLTGVTSFAQLVVSNTLTPQQLVVQKLLGAGVVASNITFTGSANAIGYFSGNTNIGLDSGIVMTTRTIFSPNGPAGPNNTGGSGFENNIGGDPALDSLLADTNIKTRNAAILEFDFVAVSDTIKFRYVFGSEEYEEYVCSVFTDIFAFLLSGPNPLGGNYKNTNLALIPGSTYPVAINSVNPGVAGTAGSAPNCSSLNPNWQNDKIYYVFNSQNTIQYDGFTVVLNAYAPVKCGEKYHIKLAIADAVDGAWDSGVFLEAGSFKSVGVNVSSQISTGNDTILFEDCGQAKLFFGRGGFNIAQADTFYYTISGTATNGTDYSFLPDSIYFPPGISSVSYTINALADGIPEGLESLTITFKPKSGICLNSNATAITLYIKDLTPITVSHTPYKVCPGISITIAPTVTGGSGQYYYSWSGPGIGGVTAPSLTISPTTTSSYTVVVKDSCLTAGISDTIKVEVVSALPLLVDVGKDTVVNCPVGTTNINALVSGGTQPFTYTWSNGSNASSIAVAPNITTSYFVTVHDSCGAIVAKDTIKITVANNLSVSAGPDKTVVCPGDTVALTATVTGGSATGLVYSWSSGQSTTAIQVHPLITTNYVITVTDNCGPKTVKDTVAVKVPPAAPLNVIAKYDTTLCVGDAGSLVVTAAGGYSTIYAYSWTSVSGTNSVTNPANANTGYTAVSTDQFIISVTDVCGINGKDTVDVTVWPDCAVVMPNIFTPNTDGKNDILFIKNLDRNPQSKLVIYNRWGKIVFENEDYKNDWNGDDVSDGTYYYILYLKNGKELTGFVTILR